MADVKWIKMMVGMFDGMSFKKIKRAKRDGKSIRDKLTAVWFELMDLAGRCNHDGAFVDSTGIPFAGLEDIATQIDRDEEELELCMAFYEKEGMVKVVDDVYILSNWGEYQNLDGMEKIREQNRLRKQKQREKQKLISEGSQDGHGTVTQCHGTEEEREEDKEREEEIHSFIQEKSDSDSSFFFAEEAKRKVIGGELGKGVVMLSDEQLNDLLEKLSLDEFDHYVSVVADCILSGKRYTKKTHYQAILDMAARDRKVK